MNSVNLMGRLTKDPELRLTGKGLSVCNFTLAINRSYKNANGEYEADFINCVAWRGTADFISKYFSKGQMMAVSGTLQTSNWETDSGEKRYKTEVLAEKVFFTGSKKDSTVNTNNNGPSSASASSYLDVDDDESFLPFDL